MKTEQEIKELANKIYKHDGIITSGLDYEIVDSIQDKKEGFVRAYMLAQTDMQAHFINEAIGFVEWIVGFNGLVIDVKDIYKRKNNNI